MLAAKPLRARTAAPPLAASSRVPDISTVHPPARPGQWSK